MAGDVYATSGSRVFIGPSVTSATDTSAEFDALAWVEIGLVEDIGGYHFLCTAGEGLADTKLRQGCMPALDVIPDCDTSELARHYAGQHFALCYGDVTEDISGLAGMLGIGCTVLSGSRKEERS